MSRFSLIILSVTIVGVVLFLFLREGVLPPSETVSPAPAPTPEASVVPTSFSKKTVTYSDSGYSPSTLKVKKGDFVVFENKNSKMMWTASAVHPTHKVYPGSDIKMCGTNTLVAIFDACKGYVLDESWEFKFDNQGTWKYHNHLQPNHTGTVVVD